MTATIDAVEARDEHDIRRKPPHAVAIGGALGHLTFQGLVEGAQSPRPPPSGPRYRCSCRSSTGPHRPRRGSGQPARCASDRRRPPAAGETRPRSSRRSREPSPSARPPRGRSSGCTSPVQPVAVKGPGPGAAVLVDPVVEPVELPIGRRGPDMVGHGLGEGPELRLAGTQRLLGALGLADVAVEGRHSARDRVDPDRQPQVVAMGRRPRSGARSRPGPARSSRGDRRPRPECRRNRETPPNGFARGSRSRGGRRAAGLPH